MRWCLLIAGTIATAAMLGISMRLNFLFGFSLGQSVERAWVFGSVSMISDAWKGLGPMLMFALVREKRLIPAAGAAAIWSVCFAYSLTSALGVAMEERSARTGNRETLHITLEDAEAEIDRLEHKRTTLRAHRSLPEVAAAIDALLAQGVAANRRVRGTVAALSRDCKRTDRRTVDACAQIAKLREELAAANEESVLDDRLRELFLRARELRKRGAARPVDPQAQLLATLSGGAQAARDIAPALSILFALMIELISAFGASVLTAYADATARNVPVARARQAGSVIDYLAECIEPGPTNASLPARDLYADYHRWCLQHDFTPLRLRACISALDHLRQENDLTKICKRKDRYYGIRLAAAQSALATE